MRLRGPLRVTSVVDRLFLNVIGHFTVASLLLLIERALSFRTVIEDYEVLLALIQASLLLEHLLRQNFDLVYVTANQVNLGWVAQLSFEIVPVLY